MSVHSLLFQEPFGVMTQNVKDGPYDVVDGKFFISGVKSLQEALSMLIGIAELCHLKYPQKLEDFCNAIVKYVFRKNIRVRAKISTTMQHLKDTC